MKSRFKGVWLTIATIGFMLGAAMMIFSSAGVSGIGYAVNFSVSGNQWSNSPDSSFLVSVWNIPATAGLEDDDYLGWCAEFNGTLTPSTTYNAMMYSTLDTNLPSHLTDEEQWDKVNYVLNHRVGIYLGNPYTHDMYEIQYAIWHFTGYSYSNIGNDPHVWILIQAADTYGSGYTPGAGDIVGYILVPYEDPQADPPEDNQNLVIEAEEPDDPPEYEDETAWAFGETELDNLTKTKNGVQVPLTDKWGWCFAYDVGDGSSGDEYKTKLWAGAGQNDVTKGYLAGYVWIWDDGDYLYVKYVLATDVYITESHVYVGDDYPTTAAPGQFPYNNDDLGYLTSYSVPAIDLDDFDGTELIIAVHGVVWA